MVSPRPAFRPRPRPGPPRQAVAGFFGQPGTEASDCPPDHYCEAGATAPTPCPPGTSSYRRANSALNCRPLPGFYGLLGRAPLPCPPGSYCPGDRNQRRVPPIACPAGHTSPQSSAAFTDCTVKNPPPPFPPP